MKLWKIKLRSEERRVGKECRSRWTQYQAEDGIRDWSVTGVQTCALPICALKEYLSSYRPGTEKTIKASRILNDKRLNFARKLKEKVNSKNDIIIADMVNALNEAVEDQA